MKKEELKFCQKIIHASWAIAGVQAERDWLSDMRNDYWIMSRRNKSLL